MTEREIIRPGCALQFFSFLFPGRGAAPQATGRRVAAPGAPCRWSHCAVPSVRGRRAAPDYGYRTLHATRVCRLADAYWAGLPGNAGVGRDRLSRRFSLGRVAHSFRPRPSSLALMLFIAKFDNNATSNVEPAGPCPSAGTSGSLVCRRRMRPARAGTRGGACRPTDAAALLCELGDAAPSGGARGTGGSARGTCRASAERQPSVSRASAELQPSVSRADARSFRRQSSAP